MSSTDKPATSLFEDRMRNFIDIVECRQALDAEDREAIYRQRYDAYRRENFIESNSDRLCIDELDYAPNKHDFGFYIAGQLVSSMRIHVVTKEQPNAATMLAFPEIVQPWLDQGQVFIDPSRFVADLEASRQYPELPLAMMKLPSMAVEYYDADYVIFTVRTEHIPFYKRVFRSVEMSEIRKFPYVDFNVILLRTETKNREEAVYKRYPYFKSTYLEQRALFREFSSGFLQQAENSVVYPV